MVETAESTNTEEFWITEFEVENAISFHTKLMSHVKETPRKPVVIYINSYGGLVDSLFSMVDSIEEAKQKADEGFYVVTAIQGVAMSAGAVLATCGDYRFVSPRSRIMLHQIQGAAWGEKRNIDIQKDELDRMNEIALQILIKNCKIKGGRKKLHDLLDRDKYLTPQEAKNIGIVDVIGSPLITEVVGYSLSAINMPKEVKNVKRKTKRTSKQSKKS